jgi:hypothetical protein
VRTDPLESWVRPTVFVIAAVVQGVLIVCPWLSS